MPFGGRLFTASAEKCISKLKSELNFFRNVSFHFVNGHTNLLH